MPYLTPRMINKRRLQQYRRQEENSQTERPFHRLGTDFQETVCFGGLEFVVEGYVDPVTGHY